MISPLLSLTNNCCSANNFWASRCVRPLIGAEMTEKRELHISCLPEFITSQSPSNKQIRVINTAWQTLSWGYSLGWLEGLQDWIQCLGPRRCFYQLGLPSAVSNKQLSNSRLHKQEGFFSYRGRRMMTLKDFSIWIPGTCEYVSLNGKKGLCSGD